MKSKALYFLLGLMTYVVLNRVIGVDSLLLEVVIVAAFAAVLYVGLKIKERSKHPKS
ncbi:MAG: hypothetical protein QNJ05_02210 [Woeseiaceae bacterium]|nr:hypothetical protein [Woeseiaceae bacterium]